MIWIVAIVGVAFILWIMKKQSKLEAAQSSEIVDEFFGKTYKEDIDWSLMVKGYPVVNDMDVRYTEWLVKKAQTSQ